MAFAARAARSQIRRYPRHLLESLHPRTLREGPFAAATDTREHLESLRSQSLAAVWLGHAGVLLALEGRLILVDPVLSARIGVRLGPLVLGKSRLEPAPLAPEDLPRADLLLLTHAHFDHLDRPTLRALAHPRTVVLTARRTRRLVPRGFGAVIEVDWNQVHERLGLRIEAIRPAHWGARAIVDRARGFNSYLIEAEASRVLLAGDTAATDAFDALGAVDLAVFGIGAYDPWIHAHATPEEVWGMFHRLGGRWLMPMHHSTFQLGDEPPEDPMRRLLAAAGDPTTPGDPGAVLRLRPGEPWLAPRDRAGGP
jgi:L-ascorbate metabolism protein UlaG (beta-lactamase superfamily)